MMAEGSQSGERRRERGSEREGFLERAFINHESQATPNLPPCFSSLAVFLV